MARYAVAGGTGQVGRHVVAALQASGHDVAVLSRANGVDLLTGAEVAEAIRGSRAVIDVTSTTSQDPDGPRAFFGTATRNLLAAEEEAGVAHHVLLSIANLDRVKPGPAHYVGKLLQEELVAHGPVPATVVRATQFHDFAAMVVSWTRHDGQAEVPPLLVQPVDTRDVGQELARAALGEPAGTYELAGPDPQDLVDMARRTLAARGESVRLVPTWHGPFGTQMAGDVLLPGPGARIGPTTFDEWLATQGSPAR